MRSIRHVAREAAFQFLYRIDIEKKVPEDLTLGIQEHLEHFDVPKEAREFAGQLIEGTLARTDQLDQKIEAKSQSWRVARMAIVDRNLLRMALYELEHFDDIPSSVTLDEAIKLAKSYGSAESPAFINGILDSLVHEKIEPTP